MCWLLGNFEVFLCAVGMICITSTNHKLSEVHGKLMAQNISLYSQLEKAQLSHDKSRDRNTPPTNRKHQEPDVMPDDNLHEHS